MSILLRSTILLLVLISASYADVVVSDPITNSSGQIETVAWSGTGNYTIFGDDFTATSTGTIKDFSVWTDVPAGTMDPSQLFSAINLYFGPATFDLSNNDTTTLTLTSSTYNYLPAGNEANSGDALFKIHFGNLNIPVTGGNLYEFAVEGIPTTSYQFALTATRCGNLGGTCPGPADQAFDGIFLAYGGTQGTGPFTFVYTTPSSGSVGEADVNFTTEAVPEPAAYTTLALGLGVFGFLNRRRRRA